MRALFHVLATIAVVPYLLLASGFLLLGQAINSGSIFAFFATLIAQFVWIVPWGIIGFAFSVLLLATLGLFPQVRWLAGLLLCLLAAIALFVILFVDRSLELGKFLFLLPCILVVLFAGWLAFSERRMS